MALLTYQLVAHPDTPPLSVTAVAVELYLTSDDEAFFSFIVRGASRLHLPQRSPSRRADNLSATTCFECFLKPVGDLAYYEFNFSPSGRWAAYKFDDYRSGGSDLILGEEPLVHRETGELDVEDCYTCDIDVDFSDVPWTKRLLGLSAVLEEEGGHKSYWALAHPPGKPDFHHADCFGAELAAPTRA